MIQSTENPANRHPVDFLAQGLPFPKPFEEDMEYQDKDEDDEDRLIATIPKSERRGQTAGSANSSSDKGDAKAKVTLSLTNQSVLQDAKTKAKTAEVWSEELSC